MSHSACNPARARWLTPSGPQPAARSHSEPSPPTPQPPPPTTLARAPGPPAAAGPATAGPSPSSTSAGASTPPAGPSPAGARKALPLRGFHTQPGDLVSLYFQYGTAEGGVTSVPVLDGRTGHYRAFVS